MIWNRVIRNTLSFFAGQSGAHAIALLFNIYMGRVLLPDDYGRLSFAIAYVVLFTVIAEYGLQTLLVRDIARDRSRAAAYFWNSIILKTLLSLIAAMLGYGVLRVFFADAPEKQFLVYLVSGSLLFNAWYFSIAAVFKAYQELHIEAVLFFIGKCVYVAGGVLALVLSGDVRLIAVAFTVGAGVQFMLALVCLVRRHRHMAFSCDMAVQRQLLARGWLFFSITLFTTMHLRFDYVLIGKFCPDADLGFYHGAYNLVLAPIILANAFVQSMYPALSELHSKGDTRFWDRVALGLRWLAALAFPVLVFATIEGARILSTVYKESFVAGTLPLQILLWGQGLDFFNPFSGHVLYVLDRQRYVILITGISVAVNVIAGVILIPLFGTVGASIAMVFSLGTMFCGYAFALRQWFPITRLLGRLAPPLIVALVAAPLPWYLRHHVPFIINGLIYAAVCYAVLFGMRALRSHDLKLLGSKAQTA